MLVYGTSSYQGFPYRHPFVTVHEVIHDGNDARLSEGQLMTPQILMDVMASLGRSVPVEILPERVLVRTAETIAWWSPPGQQTMFFSDRGDDPILKEMNGKRYPQPPLLFKACGSHLWVRGLYKSGRPKAETRLCMAPYWNCYDNGAVCTGSMKIPREKSVVGIEIWEQSFFQSEFTHASGTRKPTRFPEGLLAMWHFLEGKKEFPSKYLVKLQQTLAEFVNDHDHNNRNQGQARN
ncbi:MAG TPA: PRTRC system protein B [Candidatus Sulfotelmatobacter sp.]|nr:PRTRC system protein B [Candidatus Sulfotelmatobacter sp.]